MKNQKYICVSVIVSEILFPCNSNEKERNKISLILKTDKKYY